MPTPLHDDDDILAEALADAWIERASGDPALRRLALRAAGLAKEPAAMTTAELAAHHGITVRRIRQIEADALFKLRHHPLALLALKSLTSSSGS
jgi:hypothetical protein